MIYRSISFLQGTGNTYPEVEVQRLARAKYVICDDEPEQSAATDPVIVDY
jgi:hypothetical protein